MGTDLFTFGVDSMRRIAREVFARERQSMMFTLLQQLMSHGHTELPIRVRFRNDSGEIVPPFAVLRITGVTSLGGAGCITISKPSSSFQRLYLVNHGMTVAIGGTGQGTWLDQADLVLYNSSSGTPAYGESWGPKSGQWSLEKWRYGFTIVGGSNAISSTTVAKQHEVTAVRGVTDSAIAKNASGSVSIFDGSGADTGHDLTAANRYANVPTNRKVDVSWRGGTWDLTAAEC